MLLNNGTLPTSAKSFVLTPLTHAGGGSRPNRLVAGLLLEVSLRCRLALHFSLILTTKPAFSTITSGNNALLLPQLILLMFVNFRLGAQFNFANISPADVAKKLRGLASGKSCGPDGITNMLLKLAAGSISDSISSLFNHSLAEGVFLLRGKQL